MLSILTSLNFTTQYRLLAPLKKKAIENIIAKGGEKNADNQHFFLFPPTMFPTLPNTNFHF